MPEKDKLKVGIAVNKLFDGEWSFGLCISHSFLGETYLFIDFFKWSISIGWLQRYKVEKGEEE